MRALARREKARLARAGPVLGFWTPGDVDAMVHVATGRHGDRDGLLIRVMYAGALRVTEALSLRPRDVGPGPVVQVRCGKGGKPRPAAIPERLADGLLAYAHRHKLGDGDLFFPVSRTTAWRMVKRAAQAAGVDRDKARPHLLRHSGAIERLRQHGNPRALQLHLGHTSPDTTMRYLATLQVEEALHINQAVDPEGRR
jgi:integrase/recombinase XerD